MDSPVFDNPKPSALIRRAIEISTGNNEQDEEEDDNEEQDVEIVLDFFAGSGTTAQAVLDKNKEDDGNRKFILVQLPEPTGNKNFPTIADITKERIRRVIKKLNEEEAGQLPMNGKQDRGFRVFKLAESNFKTWDASASKDGKALEKQLELHIEHIRDGRTSEDILYEILLKSGFALTTPVEKIEVAGKSRIQRSERRHVDLSRKRTHARSHPCHGRVETSARRLSRFGICGQRSVENQCRADFQEQRDCIQDGVNETTLRPQPTIST